MDLLNVDLDTLLQETTAAHGHLCPGQILGVRMAVLGCRSVGIAEPRKGKSLIVYVEIDRCATDAIQAVTGCRLGKRTLKYIDYGKVAATFCNLRDGAAVRVLARDDARERALDFAPPGASRTAAQLEAYRRMTDEELFIVTPVRLHLPDTEMPGPPVRRVQCSRCGEGVNDGREVEQLGRVLCRACASRPYYEPIDALHAVSQPLAG